MSDFKFACPVCGQHITSDATASGTPLECPTCFQGIIVPQAPQSGESKFVLAASQVAKPRHASLQAPAAVGVKEPERRFSLPAIALVVVVVCATGAGLLLWHRGVLARKAPAPLAAAPPVKPLAKAPARPEPLLNYPIPTNFVWTLEPTNMVIPEERVSGSIHGRGFYCERALLQGGTLTLRQGKGGPADLGMSLHLVAREGEELSGKTIVIGPERLPPQPRVVLRGKDEQQKAFSQTLTNGYALKVSFGQALNHRLSGRLYLSLPDEARSFMAGSFEAEIRKAQTPKQRAPAPPKVAK